VALFSSRIQLLVVTDENAKEAQAQKSVKYWKLVSIGLTAIACYF
jgi:hypothetical protein